MSFDGTDAALAVLLTQDSSTSLPHLADADQAGQMLDGAMIAGAGTEAEALTAADLFDVEPPTDLTLVGDVQLSAGGGGWSDDNGNGYYDQGDDIIVTGYLLTVPYSGGGGSGGGGGNLGDDTASISPSEATDAIAAAEPKATPCVETTFVTPNVSLTDVNRAALAASNVISGLNHTNVEYSSIVFSLNGQVGFTEPYTDNREGEVNLLGSIGKVPAGATIMGIVHNHPAQFNVIDTYPSDPDWARYERIMDVSSSGGLERGITADRNMLLYVFTNETGKTHVYDRTDKNSERTGCSLQ
jgi:hypothetical protein